MQHQTANSARSARRSRGWRVAAVLVAACCVLIGATGVVAYFSDTQNRYVVGLASFAPILMAFSLLGIAVAAVSRRWILATASTVVAVTASALLAPVYIASDRADADTPGRGQDIDVLQANLMLGLADAGNVLDLVRSQDIDVFTAQELTFDAESALDAAGIAELLPYRYTRPTPGGGGGTGIFSRFPISGERELPVFTLSNLAVDLNVGTDDPVRVYSVHPVPPYPSPTPLWASEMDMIRSEVSTATSMTNVIVSGDFNSTRSHSKFRHILDVGYEDAADATGSGLIPTYPTDKSYPPVVGIDHVLTRGAHATALERIAIVGSDHHGLIAEIRLQ
ncbi:endonuclease/exonuclease/phosphatase family protein [Rhodococcoides fascians]|uniref:endonuclease/exonuclease/phosphatase family protein n=1 Tax=Rhodococcoides fascians TaxID=1828 RepID=UPI000690CFE9|nr:endonuclease/exonuclease/phosphatase family protein [Rhodococcus fascians]